MSRVCRPRGVDDYVVACAIFAYTTGRGLPCMVWVQRHTTGRLFSSWPANVLFLDIFDPTQDYQDFVVRRGLPLPEIWDRRLHYKAISSNNLSAITYTWPQVSVNRVSYAEYVKREQTPHTNIPGYKFLQVQDTKLSQEIHSQATDEYKYFLITRYIKHMSLNFVWPLLGLWFIERDRKTIGERKALEEKKRKKINAWPLTFPSCPLFSTDVVIPSMSGSSGTSFCWKVLDFSGVCDEKQDGLSSQQQHHKKLCNTQNFKSPNLLQN